MRHNYIKNDKYLKNICMSIFMGDILERFNAMYVVRNYSPFELIWVCCGAHLLVIDKSCTEFSISKQNIITRN